MSLPNLTPDEYNRFKISLEFILRSDIEGGYVNDPQDPGGETKWGIAKRYHPNEDIKNLTPERCAEIYYKEYWSAAGCNNLAYPLCTIVFDTAVNMGVAQSLKYLEKAKGDANEYIALRKQGYVDRVVAKPFKQKYLAGWLNRISKLQKYVETRK